MHRHEYEFWLRKYDLDGFSAGAWEIKKGAAFPSLIDNDSGRNKSRSPVQNSKPGIRKTLALKVKKPSDGGTTPTLVERQVVERRDGRLVALEAIIHR